MWFTPAIPIKQIAKALLNVKVLFIIPTMITLRDLKQLKALSDPQRMAILRRLMASSATLSQLGDALGESAAHIRHHVLALEEAGLIELESTRPVRGFLEKYYRASAKAYLVSIAIYPVGDGEGSTPVIASNDFALNQLASSRALWPAGWSPLIVAQNSLEGLIHLRERLVTMVTCHLYDPASQGYNSAFIQHLFPGEAMTLLRLYQRTQGLMLAPGNPKSIHGLEDLARADVRLINREPGSGTRLWLDDRLIRLGIPTDQVSGYAKYGPSHTAVAASIQRGEADAGLGLACSARAASLDFISLFEEPYDLVFRHSDWTDPTHTALFETLLSFPFRQQVQQYAGYSFSSTSGMTIRVN